MPGKVISPAKRIGACNIFSHILKYPPLRQPMRCWCSWSLEPFSNSGPC